MSNAVSHRPAAPERTVSAGALSSRQLLGRWLGLALSLAGIVATIWLAATGQLGLYIHPRYNVFTVGMAVLGALAAIGAVIVLGLRGARDDDDHGHHAGHEDHAGHGSRAGHADAGEPAPSPARNAARIGGAVVLLAATIGALLVLPPTTLTTATVDQRDMNGAASVPDAEPIQLASADTSQFTVRDWAMLLRQGADAEFLSGKKPELLGFVTPSPESPDVFYVARFTVTCCAVDAQPVGVPVYMPGWQDRFAVDSWVQISGSFIDNPAQGMQAVVLEPVSVEPAQQPANPYVY